LSAREQKHSSQLHLALHLKFCPEAWLHMFAVMPLSATTPTTETKKNAFLLLIERCSNKITETAVCFH
jgi:hypothetical protein